jgi:hypothetical protein
MNEVVGFLLLGNGNRRTNEGTALTALILTSALPGTERHDPRREALLNGPPGIARSWS